MEDKTRREKKWDNRLTWTKFEGIISEASARRSHDVGLDQQAQVIVWEYEIILERVIETFRGN